MNRMLVVQSSLNEDESQSNQLTHYFSELWQHSFPGGSVLIRDVVKRPVSHLSAERLKAITMSEKQTLKKRCSIVEEADIFLQEVVSADVIVLGAPMYNYSIASQLKSWFDHLARAGVSFKYTEKGPVGLLGSKPVIVISTKGGHFQGKGIDHQSPFIKQFFEFIGIHETYFVHVEGLDLGKEVQKESIKEAKTKIAQIIRELENH